VTITAPASSETAAPGQATFGALVRRGRFWIAVLVIFVVVLVLGLIVLGSSATDGQALGASSAQPSGAEAVVSVLQQQGIRVVTTSTLAEARKAATRDPGATVFVYDAGPYLTEKQWKTVGSLGRHTVAVEPDQTALDALAPGVSEEQEGLSGTLSPECNLPALAKTREITGTGARYTTKAADDTRCLPASSGGGFGLIQRSGGGHVTTLLGTSSALTNQEIGDNDNAAFALTLLGDSPTLIWYLPTVADLSPRSGTLASLTPGWVTPSIAVIALAVLAAAFWRGRRFGPLVVENLPVVVRSTETMEGRARLYERGASRTHALDQLRIGTLARLASLLGLGHGAGVDQVVTRAATLLGADPGELRSVLVDAEPGDDRDLLRLSDSLRDLEAAVARAARSR
jgi:hypothetical protein